MQLKNQLDTALYIADKNEEKKIKKLETFDLSCFNGRPPTTSDNSLAPKLTFIRNAKIPIEIEGSCLKQDEATFTHRNVVNLFLVYELDMWSTKLNTKFTLGDGLFVAMTLTKNADTTITVDAKYFVDFTKSR